MKSKLFLLISLVVDVLIAISKFVAAAFTGSSTMVSEGVHSVIDASSQVLLIWGVKTSRRKADSLRPFGYGRELYFWSFIVSLIIFLTGGCFSIYEGISRFKRPDIHGHEHWSYMVLGFAFVFNMISMVFAVRAFNRQRGEQSFWKAVTTSKDPSTFIVLLGDVGDLVSLPIAFLGVYLGHHFHDHRFDAYASLTIGVILVLISVLLVRESKSLLMGEPLGKGALTQIIELVESDSMVLRIKKHFSIYMGPEDIILQLQAVFKNGLTTVQITQAIERIIKEIQAEFPRIKQIFIEPVPGK